jgi:hypothetical protein
MRTTSNAPQPVPPQVLRSPVWGANVEGRLVGTGSPRMIGRRERAFHTAQLGRTHL